MQLTRFQMAAVKRTAQNTKKLVSSVEKLNAKMKEIAGEIVELNKQIDMWESPIKEMTGGYTSTQVIAWEGNIPEAENCVVVSGDYISAEEVNDLPSDL